MYIRKFAVRNFMIHQNTVLNPSPLTVLVGPNGGGKSALFDAMLNFSMVSRGSISQAFGPYPFSYNATLWRGASNISRIHYEVEMSRSVDDKDYLKYEIAYAYAQSSRGSGKPEYTIYTERLTKQPSGDTLFDRENPSAYEAFCDILNTDKSLFAALRQAQIAGYGAHDHNELLLYCSNQISRFNKFRLDPNELAQPSRLPDFSDDVTNVAPPRIGYRGEDLAGTLYYLSQTQSPILETIQDKVREIEPNFHNFEFNTVGTERIGFSATYSDSRQTVPSVRLSSGTLIYIGLIVLVVAANRPPLLMIEEPENGLTPQAVKSFYRAVRELANNEDADKRSQVLMSSHSPFVICEAWNGEDRDFIHQAKIVDGKTLIRRFSDAIEKQEIHLAKRDGERVYLSLKNAEEIMSGYLS